MNTPKGQSANPNGKDYLRRIHAILNERYADEQQAVAALDWARSARDKSGSPVADRVIIREALIALYEKHGGHFEPLPQSQSSAALSAETINLIVQAISEQFDQRLETLLTDLGQNVPYFAKPENRAALRQSVNMSFNSAVSTSNLTGESFKFDDEDE